AWQLALLALAILGAVRANRMQAAALDRRWAALAWLLIPVGLMLAVSLGQPYYRARFLMPALPAFHLLIGSGVAVLAALLSRAWPARRIRAMVALVCCALIVAASTGSLYREWFDPAYWRDDYRGAAAAVAATARRDDAIIYNGQSQVEAFDMYFQGGQQRYLVPRVRPIDASAATAELREIAASHARLYGLFYVLEESDPQGIMIAWLDEHAFRATSQWFGGLQLIVWETGSIPNAPHPVDAVFDGDVRLTQAAFDTGPIRRGDAVRVQLEWQGAGSASLNVFAHLLDTDGGVVSQYDGPLTPGRPSRFAVLAPRQLPPGTYRLIAGVYDGATGKRSATQSGMDHVELAVLQVE
ncbi:MAG TPA: hypothetical protein VFT99_22850, partial [Roseiflexaceae bacterium]|nr:hypothetical protein [Roseiflexaceae bacterium]